MSIVPSFVRRPAAAVAAIAGLAAGCAGVPVDDQVRSLNITAEFDAKTAGCVAKSDWNGAGGGKLDLEKHLIVAGSDGHLLSHGGSNRRAADGLIESIVRWAETRDKAAPVRVVFYFNGGLVARERVMQQAARQVPCMLSDGVYPVFMVWDTELWRSYGEQAFLLRDGHLSPRTGYAGGALTVVGDAIEGLGRAPSTYVSQGRRYVRTLLPRRACDYVVLASDNSSEDDDCPNLHKLGFVQADRVVGKDRNVLVDLDAVDDHSPPAPLRDSLFALLLPVRTATTPVVDGMGNTAWANFVRRTRTPIRKPVEFDLYRDACPNSWEEDRTSYPEGTGAFSRVFKLLALARRGDSFPPNKWTCVEGRDDEIEAPTEDERRVALKNQQAFKKLDRDKRLSITMIGHSMGAIAINELVSIYRDLPYRDIVFMAAAASIRDTRRAIEPLLLDEPELRFYNLMLHPMNDARDRYYGGAVPGGSLLLWIDEMYEPALTPEDKTMGYWPNAKASRRLFWTERENKQRKREYHIREHMLYRVFNRKRAGTSLCDGLGCGELANPTGHGNFDDDHMCFWRPAFWGAAATTWRERYRDIPGALAECRVEARN